jgi:predicted kinase
VALRSPVLIVLSGLPASGKTTIARRLARELGAVHVRVDSIEQALRDSGRLQADMADLGYRVGHIVAEDNLRLGLTVVADSVNPWPITREAWRDVAARVGVRVVDVEIVCSDAAEHRRRADTRPSDVPGLTLPSWAEIEARDYRPWGTPRLVVDTAGRDPADCVRDLCAQLETAVGGLT